MKFAKFIFAALVFVALPLKAATAPVIIYEDNGGDVEAYNGRFEQIEMSHKPVVLAGSCYSACVRFMKLSNICATPEAHFYMHAITNNKDKAMPKDSREDTREHETAESYRLQDKYHAFSFHLVRGWHPDKHLEDGVSIVYEQDPEHPSMYHQYLRVRANKLIPSCTPR
jgi:hypothetical protein